MDKVAVRKAVGVQYPVTGAPILVTGGGGGRGRGAVGVTRGQRALGALGMLAGAAGALTGQHRSLGGLVQSAISGGAQGSALGRGIGRGLTSRERQAAADREEGIRQQYAARQAAGDMGLFQGRSRFGRTVGTASRNPTIMENQMRYVDRERAEAAAQQRAQAQFEAAANRARGYDLGREQREDLERIERLRNMTMMSNEDIDAAQTRANAASSGSRPVRVEPANFEEGPQPVDASGRPVVVQLPQLPPPAGSVGSGNETADRAGQGVTDATGFNMQTENEPGDVAVRPSQPMEGEVDDPMRPSAMSQEAMRRMMRQGGRVAVEDEGNETRQTNFGEF